MTPAQAADLAARTIEAIDVDFGMPDTLAADRERVASDLDGLRHHAAPSVCSPDEPRPCPDARRYADGLRRTAALYGVTP